MVFGVAPLIDPGKCEHGLSFLRNLQGRSALNKTYTLQGNIQLQKQNEHESILMMINQ